MTREIRHIVFDIGGVLIHWDPEIPYRKLIPDAEERRWFLAEVCNAAWNAEQDRGRSWREAEDLLIGEYPAHAEHIRAYRKHWIDMVPHAHDDTVALMMSLIERGIDVTMLTNWNQDTFAQAKGKFGFLSATRGVTVSGEVGLMKPDRAIFDHHCKTFSIEPAVALFIDDSHKNVEAAQHAGWQAIHHESESALRSALHALGVKA